MNRAALLRWIVTAAIAASACKLVVHHATPVDAALPLLAVIVTVLAALSYPSLMLGVPLLVIAEIAVVDETTRLLMFGIVMAVAFAIATGGHPSSAFGTFSPRAARGEGWSSSQPSPLRRGEKVPKADEGSSILVTLAAIVALRWIPFSDLHLGRELFLLIVAALIVLVLDRTPFAIALAVIVTLITPAIPLRTLLLPIAVLVIAVLAKLFGMPKLRLAWPSAAALAMVMLFFAWSGVVARAFPYLLQRARPERSRFTVNQAIGAKTELLLDVPMGYTSLIVSGANVANLPRGTALGAMDGRVIRIGDAADWGSFRLESFYDARNPVPRDAAGKLRGYGYAAWIDGAGRIPLPPHARTIRIVADAALPPGAQLQVEGFE